MANAEIVGQLFIGDPTVQTGNGSEAPCARIVGTAIATADERVMSRSPAVEPAEVTSRLK